MVSFGNLTTGSGIHIAPSGGISALHTELRSAIEQGQLVLHYQPLADLQTGDIRALEAVVRWRHPVLGDVPPAHFIPVAEECGLAGKLDEWALRQSCSDLRRWQDDGIPVVQTTVNVSPLQFQDGALLPIITAALADAGLDAHLLCLEMTENILMHDTSATITAIARLKTLGIQLALDDFGAGFSSLSYLKRFSFDKIKIGRSLVEQIGVGCDDGAILKAMISMAHGLGIRVTADGVETEPQCDFLRRHMCDEMQGSFFCAALPPDAAAALLREGRRLPRHLLRLNKPPRTLLLVDDEANILTALKRLFRRDNCTILTAGSGEEGLDMLAQHKVGVIVSDQRMPGMTGVEFLSRVKDMYPETVRMVLSGYTELNSVTDAVNKGAIYKFLTKPWDDTQLRSHVEEAFQRKEMADENLRLTRELLTANFALAEANRRLEEVLRQQQQRIISDEISLDVVHEALRNIPIPVLGLDEEEMIVFVNDAAEALFRKEGTVLGLDANTVMPELLQALNAGIDDAQYLAEPGGIAYQISVHGMGHGSQSRGKLISLTRGQE